MTPVETVKAVAAGKRVNGRDHFKAQNAGFVAIVNGRLVVTAAGRAAARLDEPVEPPKSVLPAGRPGKPVRVKATNK